MAEVQQVGLRNVVATINADVKKRNAYADKVEVVKNDSIRFIINMLDGGVPFTDVQMRDITTATLVNLRRDNVPITLAGVTLEGNQIAFDVDRRVTELTGVVLAMVQLYDINMNRLSSLSFSYSVAADLSGEKHPKVLEEEQTLIEVVLGDGPLVIENTMRSAERANEAAELATSEADRAKVEADYIKARKALIEQSIADSANAKTSSGQALITSDEAKTIAKLVEEQFDRIISETGDSIPEITQARDGFANLNARLNDMARIKDEDTGKMYQFKLRQKDGRVIFAYEEVL